MNSLELNAIGSHPMFKNISQENCKSLMGCLGCVEKTYKKDQIISLS